MPPVAGLVLPTDSYCFPSYSPCVLNAVALADVWTVFCIGGFRVDEELLLKLVLIYLIKFIAVL